MRPPAFPGFPRKGLSFLAALARNNHRHWFVGRKDDFERHVKGPMLALVEAVNRVLHSVAPDCVTPPAEALTRMHRDLRFSRSRAPYWTSIGAHLHGKGGPRTAPWGFFLCVSPAGGLVAGGARRLSPAQLAALRRHIAAAHGSVRGLVEKAERGGVLKPLPFERLARVPRGIPADHPAADLLTRRDFWFQIPLPTPHLRSPHLVREIARRLRTLAPLVNHLRSVTA